MFIYVTYAILVVINVGISIVLLKKKQVLIPVLDLIPTTISLLFFWYYADINEYWTVICDESTGCMNETGLIAAISFFFIYVATIILFFSLILKMLLKLSKK